MFGSVRRQRQRLRLLARGVTKMGFAYQEPLDSSGGGGDYSGDSTTTVTTYDDYSENISTSSTDGGFATSDPYVGESYDSTTRQGGEHTYDIDDSVADDPALNYSSINDPRQLGDTTGTAGGEVEDTSVPSGWAGGIGAGLGGEEQEGSVFPTGYGGTDISDDQQEQVDAVDDVTDDFVVGIQAREASEAWWNRNTPDVPGDSDGDGVPDNVPLVPDIPEFPDPSDTDAIGVGLLLAAAVAIYVGFRGVLA